MLRFTIILGAVFVSSEIIPEEGPGDDEYRRDQSVVMAAVDRPAFSEFGRRLINNSTILSRLSSELDEYLSSYNEYMNEASKQIKAFPKKKLHRDISNCHDLYNAEIDSMQSVRRKFAVCAAKKLDAYYNQQMYSYILKQFDDPCGTKMDESPDEVLVCYEFFKQSILKNPKTSEKMKSIMSSFDEMNFDHIRRECEFVAELEKLLNRISTMPYRMAECIDHAVREQPTTLTRIGDGVLATRDFLCRGWLGKQFTLCE